MLGMNIRLSDETFAAIDAYRRINPHHDLSDTEIIETLIRIGIRNVCKDPFDGSFARWLDAHPGRAEEWSRAVAKLRAQD